MIATDESVCALVHTFINYRDAGAQLMVADVIGEMRYQRRMNGQTLRCLVPPDEYKVHPLRAMLRDSLPIQGRAATPPAADTGEGSLCPLIFHRKGIDVEHLVYSFRKVEVLQRPECRLTLQQQVTDDALSVLALQLHPRRGGLFRCQSLEEV